MSVDYDAPAAIQERFDAAIDRAGCHAGYASEGTLRECMLEFIGWTTNKQRLHEVHVELQPGLTSSILQAEDVAAIAARPDFANVG
jgi:hypothetical protein